MKKPMTKATDQEIEEKIDRILKEYEGKLSPEEFLKQINEVAKWLDACAFHIEAIKEENDAEVIKLHLEALDVLNPEADVYQGVREGIGDLKEIQAKCIKLGVV